MARADRNYAERISATASIYLSLSRCFHYYIRMETSRKKKDELAALLGQFLNLAGGVRAESKLHARFEQFWHQQM
jgi:hypothetical protein